MYSAFRLVGYRRVKKKTSWDRCQLERDVTRTRSELKAALNNILNFRFASNSASTSNRAKTNNWSPDVGRRSAQKTRSNVRRGENASPRQTSIDKYYDCVMNSERGALIRGADPPSGHSVNSTAGDTWRAPDRRLKKNHLSAGVRITDGKSSRCLLDGKKWTAFSVWEMSVGRHGRRFASYTTHPPHILEAVISIHWPRPTRSGLAVIWYYVQIKRPSSRGLLLIGVLNIFNVTAEVPPRAAAWTNTLSC